MKKERDGEWAWKKWTAGRGSKVEDDALRRIAEPAGGFTVDEWFSVVTAVRDAILEGWEACWAAAGGDDDE